MKEKGLIQNTDSDESRDRIIIGYKSEVVKALESRDPNSKAVRTDEEIDLLETQIDSFAELWYTAKETGKTDEAARHRGDLLLLVLTCYNENRSPRTSDEEHISNAFMKALSEVMDKYNTEKGRFTHYLSFLWKKRLIDECKASEKTESLDRIISDEDSRSIYEVVAAPATGYDPQAIPFTLEGALYDLISQILNFAKMKEGNHKISPEKLEWYKAFFTEDITAAAKCSQSDALTGLHERDCFCAMDVKYLDSYMEQVCRTYHAITDTPLKTYEGFSEHINMACPWNGEKRTSRIKVPLEKQMACYFFRKSQVARGPHYCSYTELKKKIIER